MVTCKLCKKKFKVISSTHLSAIHNTSIISYKKCFSEKDVGFAISVSDLSRNDPRYKKWRKSLLKRPPSWSKGHTKVTHPSVAKISKTFKKKKIDNFATWRKSARKRGLIPQNYPPLERNEDLAFLMGMILGDGNIYRFPRTEDLRISLGTDKPGLWKYTAKIIKKVFKKDPYIRKVKNSECMVIGIYQKQLSKRLQIPTGSKKHLKISIPQWILYNKGYIIKYLRGLYEAEGSFCIHKPTYTYKFIFSNKNESLLRNVYKLLVKLDFHPHRSKYAIQISKKEEVFKINELLQFRQY